MASMIIDSTPSSAEIAMDALLATLRGASAEKIAEFRRLLHIDGAPVSLAPGGPKGTGSVASSRVKNSDIRVFPEFPLGNVVPTATDYEIPEALWQPSLCMARVFDSATPDKRWSVAVYRQGQCCKPVLADGLCEVCFKRCGSYMGKAGNWLGRLDEPIPDWAHVVGNYWFHANVATGKLFFNINAAPPGAGAGSEPPAPSAAPSVASTTSSSSAAIREAREAADAKRQAEALKKIEAVKAAKEAKELAKELAKAEREAERERKKAEREAEKEREKAAKEAAAKAAKAEREAARAEAARKAAEAKAAQKGVKATTVSVAAPVAAKPPAPVAEPTKAETNVVQVEGDVYGLVGDDLHMIDEDTGVLGPKVGKLRGSGTDDDPHRKVDCDDEEEATL
jgi:hypothetical protein